MLRPEFTFLAIDAAVIRRILLWLSQATWLKGWLTRSEPVPAPVQRKMTEVSKASTDDVEPSEPVSSQTVSAPEPVQPLKARPSAVEQAQALLEFLHRKYAGSKVRSVDVENISYPQLVRAMEWRPRPWDGRDGVGVHLGRLTGGRTFAWFDIDGERKRQRAYFIPRAITVHAAKRA